LTVAIRVTITFWMPVGRCVQCGNEFEQRAGRIRLGQSRFCSSKCHGASRRNTVKTFWSKTRPGPGGCLLWTAGVTDDGYPQFKCRGSQHRASRWIHEQCIGPIPDGHVMMHACDQPLCVALQHLSPGSQGHNVRDASAKGRIARGERSGVAKLTDDAVRDIRARFAAGEEKRSIAAAYGVTRQNVGFIVRGVTWRHVK
jgi:hypothetical protein